jgi:hypothetical protein
MCSSRCDANTPNGAKFWGASDIPLGGAPAAPPPAHAQPAVSFTPGYLIETFLTSKAALEGERKHVTVALSRIWPRACNKERCRVRSSSRLRSYGWGKAIYR